MDHAISKFITKGQFSAWTYPDNTRNYPGLNFTADKHGCESLLTLLEIMRNSEFGSCKTLELTKPANNQLLSVTNNLRIVSKQSMTLAFRKDNIDSWIIEDTSGHNLTLKFSGDYMIQFQNAILKVATGQGDFALSDNLNNHILYFWSHHA